jgi:hypothetical protein
MPLPLEATPTDPIEYAAVVALLGMMRGLKGSTGSPDAAYEVDVSRRNVRRSYRLRGGETTAMPASDWANLLANR